MFYSYYHSVYYMFITFACHCLASGSGKKDLQITAKKSWRCPKSSPKAQLTRDPRLVNIQSERKETQSKFRVHSISEYCEPGWWASTQDWQMFKAVSGACVDLNNLPVFCHAIFSNYFLFLVNLVNLRACSLIKSQDSLKQIENN